MARRKKEPEDQPQENADQNAGSADQNAGTDDTFGLPEIEYEPINRESTSAPDVKPPEPQPEINQPEYTEPEYIKEQPVTHTTMERDEVPQNEYTSSYYNNDDDEGNSPWPKILGVAAILLIIGGAIWFFGFHKPKQEAEAKAKAEQEERARNEASRIEDERMAEQTRLAAEERRKADSLASATPAAGSIETLNERTGRYYVVIASAIDGDLIMDYAQKLSQKGISAKIIAPYGRVRFHRLTIAEGDTFMTTQQKADDLKSEYTSDVWVIKY
jgi:hypothetical protein